MKAAWTGFGKLCGWAEGQEEFQPEDTEPGRAQKQSNTETFLGSELGRFGWNSGHGRGQSSR